MAVDDNGLSVRPAAAAADSDRWARVAWAFLHEFSFYIDRHEASNAAAQAAFHGTLEGLVVYMPCDICRQHLSAHLAQTPPPSPGVYSPDDFPNARYCVDLHNAVNERQGKCIVPFEEARAHYMDGAAQPACPASAGQGHAPGHGPEAGQAASGMRDVWTRVVGAHPLVLAGAGFIVAVVFAMLVLQLWWMWRGWR